MHECVMTREAHCPHNTEGVMNNTPDPGDTGPLVVITVTDTCTENQLCALCRHSAQMWAHCRGARGAACGLEVGSLLTRLWRCLRRGSDDGGTDPSRSALADKRPSRPRKNAKDVPCDPLSSSIGVPRQQTSAHAARQVRMPTTQSRQDGACTANALAQPSPKRVVRACGAVATAWLFVHSAEKVLTQHDPRRQCRSVDSAKNTKVSRRALEPSYCMVCARV